MYLQVAAAVAASCPIKGGRLIWSCTLRLRVIFYIRHGTGAEATDLELESERVRA